MFLRAITIAILTLSGCLNVMDKPILIEDMGDGFSLKSVILSECDGITIAQEGLNQSTEHPPVFKPAGWEQNRLNIPYSVTLFILNCLDVSIGDVEGGPHNLVLEVTNIYEPPQSCIDKLPERTFIRLIPTIVADNEKLVLQFFKYGARVFLGDFKTNVNSLISKEIDITVGTNSTNIYSKIGDIDSSPGTNTQMALFWQSTEGLFYQFEYVLRGDVGDIAPVVSSYAAPFFMNSLSGNMIQLGQTYHNTTLEGTLTIYTNSFCEDV